MNTANVSHRFSVTADRRMPFLREALDPAASQARLRQCWSAQHGGALELHAIRVVRYKPERRCLIEYDVSVEGIGELTLIGKARARGADTHTFRLMQQLRMHGFDAASPPYVGVPEPIALIPAFGMWIQRKVNGTPSMARLAGDSGVALTERIASALHFLHQAGLPARRAHALEDELRILADRLTLVGDSRPDWRPRLTTLMSACRSMVASEASIQTCGIHRDFYPAQVLVDGQRIWLLDFDLYAEGDPALDAGNFLAHLAEQGLREKADPDTFGRQENAFEKTFLKLSGENMERRIRVYRHLSLARHIWISTLFPERQSTTAGLLALCEEESRRLLGDR